MRLSGEAAKAASPFILTTNHTNDGGAVAWETTKVTKDTKAIRPGPFVWFGWFVVNLERLRRSAGSWLSWLRPFLCYPRCR